MCFTLYLYLPMAQSYPASYLSIPIKLGQDLWCIFIATHETEPLFLYRPIKSETYSFCEHFIFDMQANDRKLLKMCDTPFKKCIPK